MPDAQGATCGGINGSQSCEYYVMGSGDAERARQAGTYVPPGLCCRYPTRVPHRPDDFCGEHPVERDHWMGVLARKIVEQLDATLTSPDSEPPEEEPGEPQQGLVAPVAASGDGA